MKLSVSTLMLACPASSSAVETKHAVTPVTKVLEMLNGMAVKGEAEKKAEETKFAAFAQWCADESRVKQGEISAADDQIELLEAKSQKADAHIRKLTERVQELDEDVDRWHKDSKSATEVRDKEKVDYSATSADYADTIDAIAGAMEVLQKQAYDRPQAEAALLQVRSKVLVPVAAKAVLRSFLQQSQMPSAELSYQAPEANAYEFQSDGVVEMLQKLRNDFLTKKTQLDTEELNAQHSFEQIVQTLTDNIENAQYEMSKKTTAKEETAQSKAEAQGDLTLTQTGRAEDAQYLTETTALCRSKSRDFESRQTLRAEELVALRKAVEIIGGDTVAGVASKHLPTLLQVQRSLAQLRSTSHSPVQDRLSLFLRERAESCNSQLLSLVSQRVASDPFEKVQKMIKDLISKLVQESTAETEHKGWCDTELVTNKQTRDSKTQEVGKLTTDAEGLSAEIAQLSQSLADLAADISDLTQSMARSSVDRAESKEANGQAAREAREAQLAVTRALALLKEFYGRSADATALLDQTPAVDAPKTWDAAYTGQLGEGANVVDFLEVILADFARLEAEVTTAENAEQDAFEKFMFEAEKDKALKENESGHKASKQADKESELHSTQNELKAAQEQFDKAAAYYQKLKPACVDTGITYDERVKRRETEIQSLQEALQILSGTDIA